MLQYKSRSNKEDDPVNEGAHSPIVKERSNRKREGGCCHWQMMLEQGCRILRSGCDCGWEKIAAVGHRQGFWLISDISTVR